MGKQKRSLNTYQKINTIFKRDINNVIMPYDGLVVPELEWLRNCKFDAEEKIDGTNIRIELTRVVTYDTIKINNTEYKEDLDHPLMVSWVFDIKGKTDNANIPKKLHEYLVSHYDINTVLNALGLEEPVMEVNKFVDGKWVATDVAKKHKWCVLDGNGNPTDQFDLNRVPKKYTIYGEGYGVGIQACGGRYRDDNSFIGFDVKVDDLYLLKEQRDEVLNKLRCDIVPFIGQFTIDEAIEYVRKGFVSKLSKDKEFLAEGLVLRSPLGIKDRNGERIIFKVKTCDWDKYHDKYGTYDKVEQVANKH